MAKGLVSCVAGAECDCRCIMALLADVNFSALDSIHSGTAQHPNVLKASKKKHDPDTSACNEAMCGKHHDDCQEAMAVERRDLSSQVICARGSESVASHMGLWSQATS